MLDGLSSKSDDFRYPGDLIEKETIPELERAYRNEVVYPDDIKNTSWGKIFVSYYPIHNGQDVIGVIGIEFDAQHQYNTFAKVRIITPIIGGVFALIAIFISVFLFRRISNPFYRDFANTDYLTDMRNRNAFELYMSNLSAKGKETDCSLGFISIDLNDLKRINDDLGHQAGDHYIQSCSNVLKRFESNKCSLYRIGGDEFVFIVIEVCLKDVTKLCDTILNAINEYNDTNETQISVASGKAVYDASLDKTIHDTLKRADENMYENKKIMKDNNKI